MFKLAAAGTRSIAGVTSRIARPQATFAHRRPIHNTTALFARKDTQDKDSINTESTEYSKSAGDDASATVTGDAAFSADKTRPEEQYATGEREAKKQGENNPLDASPANHELSKTKDPQAGGSEGSPAETGDASSSSSGGGTGKGSAPKSGKV